MTNSNSKLKTQNSKLPKVSVVIPTFNSRDLLLECVRSVYALDYGREKLQAVVVDNGSGDGTEEAVRRGYPDVKVVRLEANIGFAVACNRGAAEASGEYVAFLNDDAVVEGDWIDSLFAGLQAGGEGAVCTASQIRSRDGEEIEFSGASSNLFGVGRPRSAWGWPDAPEPPTEGSPLLFASGGAMLIHRRTFLDAGGFDPHFFMYFEDVDLGWRLWLLGHKVVYAPRAVARHVGGATGSRSPAHRRYALWECNSLATVLKNYEGGNVERILSAALMLLYRRALLSAGDAFSPEDYRLGGPRDANPANVERLPKISVAHVAAIARFNSLLPYFMAERRRVQAARVRSDAEILPLLGRPWEVQFAGREYAQAARKLAATLKLYGITEDSVPNKVLVIATEEDEQSGYELAGRLSDSALVAVATIVTGASSFDTEAKDSFTHHRLQARDPTLVGLVTQADAILVYPGAVGLSAVQEADAPVAIVGAARGVGGHERTINFKPGDYNEIEAFCKEPGMLPSA